MNWVMLTFSLLTTSMIACSSIFNFFENKIPTFFSKTFRYGKFACKEKVFGVIDLPKSWFRHFYWVAVISYTFILYQATQVYVFGNEPSHRFLEFLQCLCGENRPAHTTATHIFLALILMTLQAYRRFYDTHFISVYSKNSVMNLSHYLVGIIHYPGSALAVICEAPNFTHKALSSSVDLDISQLSYTDIAAVIIFLWAWWHQHKTTKILADLRKNEKGDLVSNDHKVPYGDWFDYLSAPHQNAEILMYFSITILLWYNITWFFVFAWVLSNQVETILLSHWWYQETFDKFPKNRKALIPLIC
ncbi:unnamed protein product [Phaedon cochleariae]|uniref:Polyprenal reductase n=1 Tax=Phaedon cochleariae TaxID=80249 RepID=A0A9P0DN33_PHACE|nr:unnamed protein product [Phaedon cochleariae]